MSEEIKGAEVESSEAKTLADDAKKAWLSKTLWTNVIMAVAAIFWPAASDFIAQNPEVSAVFFSGVNFLLRFVTKDKLSIQK